MRLGRAYTIKFYAFDTETVNRPGHGEACLLIKMGVDGHVKFLEFPNSFREFYSFLFPGRYVAWNLDFDVRATCHDFFLPFNCVENLAIYGRCSWEGLRLKYVPSKFLKIIGNGGSIELYDLAQFYGSSLAQASEVYLPKESRKGEIPQSWYNEMDHCLRDGRRLSVLNYAEKDVISTQALADRLLGQIQNLSLKPRGLSSCAALARGKYDKVFRAIRPPDYVNRIFETSFFGGRIEVRCLGALGRSSLFDIHSAYPSVIAGLVDPRGECVESGPDWRYREATYGCYKIRVKVPLSWPWGPLAVRSGSHVIYPVGVFQTTCGVPGIEALRRDGISFSVETAYEIFAKSKTPIFSDIERLYLSRKEPGLDMVVKILLNSIYGVMAESVNYNLEVPDFIDGSRDLGPARIKSYSKYGTFANFILAAHITESIRMQIWGILKAHGKRVSFVATDGVLVDDEVRLITGPKIGAWDLKGSYASPVIFGCGRYILDETISRLRGFPQSAEILSRLKATKTSYSDIPILETGTLREWACDLGSDLNVLTKVNRRFKIEDNKRHWNGRFKTISEAFERRISSMPFILGTPNQLEDLIHEREVACA